MLFYVKKMQKQNFDMSKFISTLIVGLFVGITMANNGTFNEMSFENQMVAYMGIIAVVENVVKAVIRTISGKSKVNYQGGGLPKK